MAEIYRCRGLCIFHSISYCLALARGRIAQFNEEQKAELERRLAKVEQALADLKDEDDWI